MTTKAATDQEGQEYALLLEQDDESTYYLHQHRTYTCRIIVPVPGQDDYHYISSDQDPFADLRITALQSDASLNDGNPYAWEVEYHQAYTVGLERAENMVKTLRKITTSYERMRKDLGSPADFASYVAYMAAAMGVRKCMYVHSARVRQHSGINYWLGGIPDAVSHLRQLARDWKEAHTTSTSTVAA